MTSFKLNKTFIHTIVLGLMVVFAASCSSVPRPKPKPIVRNDYKLTQEIKACQPLWSDVVNTILYANVKKYKVVHYPTPNFDPLKVNTVEGVILHHTATRDIEQSLYILTSKVQGVSVQCVIDKDGTRYILCSPETVAFHAGKSVLNGRTSCNDFTIGIEFQGNTLNEPLTEEQVHSAIEYLLPIISKYHIPLENIVTHAMVRSTFKRMYPDVKVYGKVDIIHIEYVKFLGVLSQAHYF